MARASGNVLSDSHCDHSASASAFMVGRPYSQHLNPSTWSHCLTRSVRICQPIFERRRPTERGNYNNPLVCPVAIGLPFVDIIDQIKLTFFIKENRSAARKSGKCRKIVDSAWRNCSFLKQNGPFPRKSGKCLEIIDIHWPHWRFLKETKCPLQHMFFRWVRGRSQEKCSTFS